MDAIIKGNFDSVIDLLLPIRAVLGNNGVCKKQRQS